MADRSLIVVALGGNAISRSSQEGNVGEQFTNSCRTAESLVTLVEEGHQLVITHGNGPQIGNFLLRNLAASGVVYPLPMEVAVAHVQGGMGYMIAQAVMNELANRGNPRAVTTIVTTIEVDRDDPAFANPTKPIGRRLTIDDAQRLAREEGWQTHEVSPGTYRRVVPSPAPRKIQEIELIRRAVEAGDLLVTCGGGGIPVVRDSENGLSGVRAVIDKDLASAVLATELEADVLMILTNVDRVSLNHGRSDEQALDRMTLDQAKQWMADGQFPPGSMGPKIEGAINFLSATSKPDGRVVIGPLERAADALAGRTGTCISR